MNGKDTPSSSGDPNGPAQSNRTHETDIQVVDAIDAVRLRPEMYIGPDREAGIIQLINPAVETLLRQGARNVQVTLQTDNIVTITDDGPGLSLDPRRPDGRPPFAQECLTELLCGFGAPTLVVTNALSQWLELTIWGNGYQWEQSYRLGRPLDELHQSGVTEKHGNSLRFMPDPALFQEIAYDFDKVAGWFRKRESDFEQLLAKEEPRDWYGKAKRDLAVLFRNAHTTIIDERFITSNPDGARRATFRPGPLATGSD
jgi:DNA gyrase/topoisomerase IV subunit B